MLFFKEFKRFLQILMQQTQFHIPYEVVEKIECSQRMYLLLEDGNDQLANFQTIFQNNRTGEVRCLISIK